MAYRNHPDDWGLGRVRSDGTEAREAKVSMFRANDRIPVGREREGMSEAEFMQRAAPVLASAHSREQAIMESLNQFGQDRHGGDKIAGIVFNQGERQMAHQDNWGISRVRNVDPNAGRANVSQLHSVFDDQHAGALVDGRGDGRPSRIKGQLPLSGGPQDRGLVPTSRILGADANKNWVVDRDQRLEYATDPAMLAQAAKVSAEDHEKFKQNRNSMRGSRVPMGEYDLNPGGHRLNAELERADDCARALCRGRLWA